MPEPTLELIQTMMQRGFDALGLLREDVSNLRRRVGCMEHSINSLRRDHVDYAEAETARQDMADRVSERLETIESRLGISPKH